MTWKAAFVVQFPLACAGAVELAEMFLGGGGVCLQIAQDNVCATWHLVQK